MAENSSTGSVGAALEPAEVPAPPDGAVSGSVSLPTLPSAEPNVAPPLEPNTGAGAETTDAPPVGEPLTLEQAQQGLEEAARLAQNGETLLEVPKQQGFMHFIAQSDLVGKSLFALLIIMSLVSWYLIIVKALGHLSMKRRSQRFLQRFWQAESLDAVGEKIAQHPVRDPFSHLTQKALQARAHHARFGVAKLADAGTESEFVTRTMRKVIDQETAQLESGLTVLASVGSTAPFVGLFGTVWGVYHALVAIGMGGGATIDRIAGPVGEALIMTGLGLAVAIPAVLGFNAFVRRNRVLLARLDAFAYDLFTVLTTGQHVDTAPTQSAARRAA